MLVRILQQGFRCKLHLMMQCHTFVEPPTPSFKFLRQRLTSSSWQATEFAFAFINLEINAIKQVWRWARQLAMLYGACHPP